MPTARDVVTAHVAQQARRFPRLYPTALDTAGLDGRDRALARAIDQAVARRWLTLVAVTESRLDRAWASLRPDVAAILLVGAAQLLLLERLPDHAVINEAVAWAKRRTPRAAGLVNAVLRGVAALRAERLAGPAAGARATIPGPDHLPLADGRRWRLNEPIFGSDPLPRLAGQTSHPLSLLESWTSSFGMDAAVKLALHDLVHPPIIIAGYDGDRPPAGLSPHASPGFALFEGDREALEAVLAGNQALRVQDPAAAAPVRATAGLLPDLIVELCAGRGTKTRQLAAVHPQARIFATDGKPAKLAELARAFDSHDRVRVVKSDELMELAGQADLVVADVPCSNTAVLARRVEARYRFDPAALTALGDLQKQILADAMRWLGPGGHLLYSTCSLEPAENQHQIDWIQRWHRLRAVESALLLPRGEPGEPADRYSDGGFFALLQRPAEGDVVGRGRV